MLRQIDCRRIILCLAMIVVAALFLLPFYISFVYAFKTSQEITFTGLAFPRALHFENYTMAIERSNFWRAFMNTVKATIPGILLLLVICPPAAYVLGRNSSKLYNAIYVAFMAALLIPFQSIMLPIYINLKALHLNNTILGLTLARSAFSISINMLVITGFVKNVPNEMEEAASIDGCGPFRTFWVIVFPLLSPVIASMLVMNALSSWNDFTLSFIILMKKNVETLPVMLFNFFGQYSVELNYAFAAASISMLPVLLFYLLMQKYIISGVTAGAVKG
jgi:raffinose/stachyose/melibiose transport system permease protein